MEKTKLRITPKTKVLELIEAYPHLEEVLIKHVPAFSKLKNPLLRENSCKNCNTATGSQYWKC